MARIYRRIPNIDHVDWKLAIDLYHAEKLTEAYDTALDSGMGASAQYLDWFRTIEAEYQTATRSTITLIRSVDHSGVSQDIQFELEQIPEEVAHHLRSLQETIVRA